MQNLVYEWVHFSKFGQIWAKIGSNLRKFWKKLVILFKIWPKIGPIGIWMGYFFLKNWYLYGSSFKFRGGTSLPKPNMSTPPVLISHIFLCVLVILCVIGRYRWKSIILSVIGRYWWKFCSWFWSKLWFSHDHTMCQTVPRCTIRALSGK